LRRLVARLTSSAVTPDQELVVIFGALHLVALAFGGLLLVMFFRSETVSPWEGDDGEDEGGGGGNDRTGGPPKAPNPSGGLPLPESAPARVRLRDHRRLADGYPATPRRREHAPEPRPRVPSKD
jgi:hypothetical protein